MIILYCLGLVLLICCPFVILIRYNLIGDFVTFCFSRPIGFKLSDLEKEIVTGKINSFL